jgi:hypothetical protein
MTAMTKGERDELQRLVRQREKVLKSAAKQRSAELIADFENQLGARYSFDDDKIWAEATKIAQQEIDRAETKIAARAAELGIPKEFAPSIGLHWYDRGENAVEKRRAELRKIATTRVAAIEAKAIVEIELQSVDAQTQIAQAGLTSEAARAFLERLRPVEALMPKLSFEEIAGKAVTPIAEQLTSPGALRQQRYRERHRNAQVTLRDANSEDAK